MTDELLTEVLYTENGHYISIPWRYWSRETDSDLMEQGPRVACALATPRMAEPREA